MNKFFHIVIIGVFVHVCTQVSYARDSENFSTNKIHLSKESSPILESTVLELDVAYDIALAKQDYDLASSVLREMGVAYYNHGQLNLAKEYVWKSKIITEYYDLKEQNLLSTAFLSKINLEQGDNRAAIELEEEYAELLKQFSSVNKSLINVDLPKKDEGALVNQEKGSSFPVSVLFTVIGLAGLLVGINHLPQKKTNNQFNQRVHEQSEIYDIDINLESLNINDVLDDDYFDASKLNDTKTFSKIEPETVAKPIKDEEILEPVIPKVVPVTNSLNNLSEKKLEVELEEPIEDVSEVKEIVEVEMQPNLEPVESDRAAKVSYHPKKAQPLSKNAVLEARGNTFHEKTGGKKLPLWVSGIEHHIKNVNLIDGIRFDFNYTGNFTLIPEHVHSVFTKFLTSFIDELARSTNVQSVSAILVNSPMGLVMQLVIKPIHAREPVLSLQTQMRYKQSLNNYSSCQVVFSENENAELKTVLKYVENSNELVS